MSDTVQKIKDRLGITEVVSSYVKLERAGQNFKARCPFHNEKTPSFFISPGRGSYYCFGCGAKGDIFSFVEQFEGLDFLGALKLLAARAGVEIRPEDPKKRDERERLFALMEDAAVFFEGNLARNEAARDYLRGRGLEEKSLGLWRLGYAPDEWESAYTSMRSRGYSDREILIAGITKPSEKQRGKSYDRFRGRIMFPLFDSGGRVIAFSGRLFPGSEGAEAPKYLNSPETPIFHKGNVLYGLDKAKFSIRKYNFAMVVEGQMDLLMAHQAGFSNAVALSGTALTREQLGHLRRLSDNVLLAYDADAAGIAATQKAALIALELSLNAKVAHFPAGLDPAQLIKEDKEAFKRAVREGKHIVDYLLDVIASEGYDGRKFRLAVQAQVLPFIARIENRIDRAHFISRVASRIHLSEEPIREEVEKLTASVPPAEGVVGSEERDVQRSAGLNALLGILLGQAKSALKAMDATVMEARLKEVLGEEFEKVIKAAKAEEEELIFQAEAAFGGSEDIKRDVDELFGRLEEGELRRRLEDILSRLRESEEKGDEARSEELLRESKNVSDKLMSLTKGPFA